jgi:hypothetical protein
MKLDEYRDFAKSKGKKAPRGKPELQLQIAMKWTSSLAGVFLGPKQLGDALASGLNPDFPDLQFVRLGVTRYVEVKTKTGRLSEGQKEFRDLTEPYGVWALCRSLDAFMRQVTIWGLVRDAARLAA